MKRWMQHCPYKENMQKKNCNKLHCLMKPTSTINEACFDD